MWHFGQEDGRPTRYIIPNYAEGVYFNQHILRYHLNVLFMLVSGVFGIRSKWEWAQVDCDRFAVELTLHIN